MNFDAQEWPPLKTEASTFRPKMSVSNSKNTATATSSSSNSCLSWSSGKCYTVPTSNHGNQMSHHNIFVRRSSLLAVTEEDEKSVGSSSSNNNNTDDVFFSAADDTSVPRRTIPLYREPGETGKDDALCDDVAATSISSMNTCLGGEDSLTQLKWWPSYTSPSEATMSTPKQPPKRSCLDLEQSTIASSNESPFRRFITFKSAQSPSSIGTTPHGMESPAPSLALSELSYGLAPSPFAPSFADAPIARPNILRSSSSTAFASLHDTIVPSNKSPHSCYMNGNKKQAPNHDYFFTPIREDDEFTSFLSARCSSVSTIGSDMITDTMAPLPQCRPKSNHSDSLSLSHPCLPLENDEVIGGGYFLSMFNRCSSSSTIDDTSFTNLPNASDANKNDFEIFSSRATDSKLSSFPDITSRDKIEGDDRSSSPELWKTPVKLSARVLAHYHAFEYDSSQYPNKRGSCQPATRTSHIESASPSKTVERTVFDLEFMKTPLHANRKYSIDNDSPSRCSPLPQNLKGDPNRQAKVKTELCRSFSLGLVCPFGSRCNYAHGEDELKYTTLFELKRADLVSDIESYRAYPCFSFVATGACPYGLRCGNIHDPRVAGSYSSWLPHSEVPVSSLDTDMNVDKTHHELLAGLNQENALLPKVLWDNRSSLKNPSVAEKTDDVNTEWRDVYALVCNLSNLNESSPTKLVDAYKSNLSELHRLCIALYMNCDCDRARGYIYKPRHLIYNELCMVLRTKYFKILNAQHITDEMKSPDRIPLSYFIEETSLDEYQRLRSHTRTDDLRAVVVHELAFGCAGEQAARVSLWFNLDHVTEMSITDVKRYKRQKQRTRNGERMNPIPGAKASESDTGKGSSFSNRDQYSFETHPYKPFFYAHPVNNDEAARNLVTNILHHRLSVIVQREFRYFSLDEAECRAFFASYDHMLRETYFIVKENIQKWRFPVSKGLELLTEHTPVPKCNSHYVPSSNSHGNYISSIWSSFTCRQNEDTNKKSLNIFDLLRQGNTLSINSRSIKLINSFENSVIFKDEWKMIREHYQMTDQLKSLDDGAMPLSPSQIEKRF